MKKFFIISMSVLLNIPAVAAGEDVIAGTRAGGMGGVSVMLSDLWSVQNNPGGLAFVKGIQAGIWVENRFLLQGLNTAGATLAINFRPGTFALHMSHFGNSDYGELSAGLSYGRLFGKSFAAGLRIAIFNIHASAGYGSKTLPACALGFQFRPQKRWILGLLIENPVPVIVSEETGEVLPLLLKTGIGGFFNQNLRIMTEVEKVIGRPFILRAGCEYIVVPMFVIRLGYSSKPGTVSAGTSIILERWEIGISTGFHPVLGWTPGLSIQWIIRSSKK